MKENIKKNWRTGREIAKRAWEASLYQSQVSILGPVGYGPTTLPLRHSDCWESNGTNFIYPIVYHQQNQTQKRKPCNNIRQPSFAVEPMRRRPGIGGLQTAAAARDQYRILGENVAKIRSDLMREQLATFRSQLDEFARKHKNDIRKNPTFRAQFHEMCAKVGVDPLASNKGFWAELLGIGDFYYELGVQILEICLATRLHNGGLISLQELCTLLRQKRRSDREAVSEDDCLRAISKLKILGSGYELIACGKRKLFRSVPTELNKDHNAILELAQAQGFVTVDEVERRLSWTSGRAIDALDTLLEEGLAMIDDGHKDGKRRYLFPCVSFVFSSIGSDI